MANDESKDEHQGTPEQEEQKMHQGEKEVNVYSEQGREELVEEDGMNTAEEGFSQGAEDGGDLGTCATCDKVLGDRDANIVEKEINNEKVFFCSDECASKAQ